MAKNAASGLQEILCVLQALDMTVWVKVLVLYSFTVFKLHEIGMMRKKKDNRTHYNQ